MKYIPAEKLIAEIERRIKDCKKANGHFKPPRTRNAVCYDELADLLEIIHSLQQDKDVLDLCSRVWWEDRGWMMIPPNVTLKGIESLLMQLRKKLQAESSDFDDVDPKHLVHTHQEQPEVDLEKEMDKYYDSPLWDGEDVSWMTYTRIAHHFYELGRQNCSKISNNSLKELRKEVIKFNQDHFDELHSDMDTIDIVHIVAVHFFKLGLNARK